MLQFAQFLARLDPEFVDEQPARVRIDAQRLGLPPGPVERQHELGTKPFPVRIRLHQRLQLAHDGSRPPPREIRVDPRLQRGQPPLV
jgi:hypothetical protein